MNEIENIPQSLNMYDVPLPDGWVILGYGVDGTVGNQYIRIKLPNGIVASIIRGQYTYGGRDGRWEIAPCWDEGNGEFSVMYMEEMRAVCDWTDVEGWLDENGVMQRLEELADVDAFRVSVLKEAFYKLRK